MSAAVVDSDNRRHSRSDTEWQVRVDLAACYRLIHHFGMTDLIYNHITARVPGPEHHVLINPYGLLYTEITASNLVKIDLDGRQIDDTPYEINPAGFTIHSAVHGARPEVGCVIHTHSMAGCAVSSLDEGLVCMDQQGMQFYNRVGYHDFGGFALDDDEKRALISNLGQHRALILRNHGLLTTGATVAEAFRLIYYLERACRLQLEVQQTQRPVRLPSPEVCEHTARQWDNAAAGILIDGVPREWPALKRMLTVEDPSFEH